MKFSKFLLGLLMVGFFSYQPALSITANPIDKLFEFIGKIIWPVSPYQNVYIRCNETYCELICGGTGSDICTWESGFNNPCIDCSEWGLVASNANVDEMHNHAVNQIQLNNHNGSYSNHIIYGDMTYYRTVTWEYIEEADEHKIVVKVTYYEEE